jgi:hypothetical protein
MIVDTKIRRPKSEGLNPAEPLNQEPRTSRGEAPGCFGGLRYRGRVALTRCGAANRQLTGIKSVVSGFTSLILKGSEA